MTRRVNTLPGVVTLTLALLWTVAPAVAASLRVATFRSDATPPAGEPLIWVTPVGKVEDPLWAKGIVIDDGARRYVLCAIDWCGVGSSTHRLFRGKMAAAAGTGISRVALHSVHQHAAPYIDGDGYRLLSKLPNPPLIMSDRYLEDVTNRLAAAIKEAAARLEPFDQVGRGEARVERVASTRRVKAADGKILVRYSSTAKTPELVAYPEEPIDPFLRTVTLARAGRPLVRIHYYATHPQTFCCDGRVSGDFVSAAREAVEREQGVFQVYFTGCSGDVTVGKYNDGSTGAREQLAARLKKGLEASNASTRFAPAGPLRWTAVPLDLVARSDQVMAAHRAFLADPAKTPADELYRSAIPVAFAARKEPLEAVLLEIGPVRVLHLPGEPMLEFQNYARGLNLGRFVVVAGYGDISPGYLCTDKAYTEGGYEPSASNVAPGTEARVKEAIRKLLD